METKKIDPWVVVFISLSRGDVLGYYRAATFKEAVQRASVAAADIRRRSRTRSLQYELDIWQSSELYHSCLRLGCGW